MDDEAASQQLMSEARANFSTDYEGSAIPLNLNGASQGTAASTPESGKKKARGQRRKQLADSRAGPRNISRGPRLPANSLKNLKTSVTTSSPSKSQTFPPSTIPSTQIEVPDTQTEPQANGAPTPTPQTSSQAAPVSVLKKSKKSKRNIQGDHDLGNGNTIPATPYEEATEETTSKSAEVAENQGARKKRRGKNKSRVSLSSVDLNSTEADETTTATQKVAPQPPAEDSDERNGVPSVEEQPVMPKSLLKNLEAERLQKSRTAGSAPSQEALEAPTEIVDANVDHEGAVQTPGATRSNGKKRRTKSDRQITETPILDWEAPVRNIDETSEPAFKFDDSDGASPSKSRRKRKSAKRTKPARYSIGGLPRAARPSRADPNKDYQRARDHDDERTAADEALEKTHELGQPPDKRTSGKFSADEEELLRRAIRDFQERNGVWDTADLVEMIHHNQRRKNEMGGNTTDQSDEQFKKEVIAFWEDIRNAGLLRAFKEIKKHVRAQYHMCQRGRWSQEEEEQLRELANLHPGNWKIIGTQLNRLELDVYNRWKDYVRHGENRVTKRWSTDEEENLVKVLSTVCQRVEDYRAETGQPPLDDYTPVINWHEVCREMGDTRSRLQCQTKWKAMKARNPPATLDIEIKPRKTPPPGLVEEAQKKRRKSKAKKNVRSELTPAGLEDMLWGDKFNLVAVLIEQTGGSDMESDEQLDWQDVAEKMNNIWSASTLQTAYQQLREVALDGTTDVDVKTALASLYSFLTKNHYPELEDRYQPPESDEADASHTNSSKKRERQRQSGAGDSKASAKKRNKIAPNAFKSKELISESDDAESGLEA